MRPETYDFLGNLNAIWTVLLGAILATGGGFVATQIEHYLESQRRERNAALLFAEVLSMMGVLLDMTHDAYGRGDPFGPVTLRMLRSAQKEIEIYDRNRENLFDIRDAALRAKIHSTVLRFAMPIEGVFDLTQEMATERALLKSSPDMPEMLRRELEEHIEELRLRREGSYEFIRETAADLRSIIASLEPIARQSFEKLASSARSQSGIVTDTAP